ncbi:MAG: hypothetical protein KA984_03480 [Candidatus Cloacimonetes bacterium]|nr:hypothetical protein [Candidatus Cloacimonadota bacterium]
MKPFRLFLLLMALAGLFLLSSCGGDDDDNNNGTQFSDWNDYWNYAQDRESVLFAHVFTENVAKDGFMYVYLWADKLPDNVSASDEFTMSVNGQPLQIVFENYEGYYSLYSYSLSIPAATSLDVEFKRNGSTLIDKTIAVPATPEFTTWDVTTPDAPASMAWSVASDSEYQVLEFWGEYMSDDDNVTYFMDPAIRSKTIPANTLDLAGYSYWDAYISANNLEEDQNSTLIAQTWDDIYSDEPTSKEDILARVKAMHLRKLNR